MAQSNYDKFLSYVASHDTDNIKTLLKNWELTKDNDPEFYVCVLNYYLDKSKKEAIQISTNRYPATEDDLSFTTDQNDTFYLKPKILFNNVYLTKSLDYANEAIEKFPNRLDIRFGKCHILRQADEYSLFTQELIAAIEYSKINNNQWLWSQNKAQEDGKQFFLSTIYTYQVELYNTYDDSLLPYMAQIGDKTIELYPDEIEILSITAVAYMLQNEYPKAITYLQKAETLNQKDPIILNNLAQLYKRTGDKKNAIKYYKLTKKYGNQSEQELADQELLELEK